MTANVMVQPFPIYLPRQRELIAVWVILPMLSNFIVGLRFYAKTKTRGAYGWSDWMIIASAVSFSAVHDARVLTLGSFSRISFLFFLF